MLENRSQFKNMLASRSFEAASRNGANIPAVALNKRRLFCLFRVALGNALTGALSGEGMAQRQHSRALLKIAAGGLLLAQGGV